MRATISIGLAVLLGAMVLGTGSVAIAKQKGPGNKGGKIIRLEAIKVEGRIQKPQAFYILQRSNLNFEALELKRSFVPEIEKSTKKDPF